MSSIRSGSNFPLPNDPGVPLDRAPAAPDRAPEAPEAAAAGEESAPEASGAPLAQLKKRRFRPFSRIGAIVLMLCRFFFLTTIPSVFRVLLITAVLSGAIGFIGYKSLQSFIVGKEVKTPNVCGSDLTAALIELRELRLTLELETRENHEEVAAGVILRQSPAPGTTVKSRTPVKVTVSLGPSRRPAPHLSGLNYIDAEIKIRQQEFKLGLRSFVHDAKVDKNLVLAQDPPRGSRLPRGHEVHLLVSLGPPLADFEMPDLLGRTLPEARVILTPMKLRINPGGVKEEDRAGVEQGMIVDQSPAAGHSVNPDTPITVTIATGIGG